MERIIAQLAGDGKFVIFYAAEKFKTGRAVTGFIVYIDGTKSSEIVFDEIGDGLYFGTFTYEVMYDGLIDKIGVLVRENTKPKQFAIVQVIR